MKVAQYLARALEQEGLRYIFGIHGSPLVPLVDYLEHESPITPILVRHEEGGAFMADGYARFSGTLGACWGTSGPGTTNLLTGLATSLTDAVPVLAIAGQVPTASFYKGAFQESTASGVDSVVLLKAVCKFAEMATHPAQVPVLVKKALRLAMTGRRGPTALVLPADLLATDIEATPPPVYSYRVGNRCFDRKMVGRAAALLTRARRPAILAGTGVSISGANAELVRLSELLGAGVATTPKAKGCFPEDHGNSVGVLGLAGHPSASRFLLDQADVILAIGTSLGQVSTNNFDPRFERKVLIHLDVEPEEIGKNFPVELGLVGDAQVILRELIEAVTELPGRSRVVAARRRRIRRFKEVEPRFFDPHLLDADTCPIYPQRAIRELRRALPRDAILFWDSGNHNLWGVHYFDTYAPKTFTYSPNFGAMGYGVSACIGAKLARPDQVVVSVCGDGGFLMNGMEVSTAVNYGVPVIWVVLNNHSLGMVYQGHKALAGRTAGGRIQDVDICSLSRGLGAQACRASTADELAESLRRAIASERPTVIDVEIDAEQVPPIPMLRPELKGAF